MSGLFFSILNWASFALKSSSFSSFSKKKNCLFRETQKLLIYSVELAHWKYIWAIKFVLLIGPIGSRYFLSVGTLKPFKASFLFWGHWPSLTSFTVFKACVDDIVSLGTWFCLSSIKMFLSNYLYDFDWWIWFTSFLFFSFFKLNFCVIFFI